MHIKSIHVQSYKRFTDLTICDLPETARLVVVTGPNGCGKSSLFDAFKTWQSIQGFGGPGIEPLYHYKQNQIMPNHNELSTIAFHEPLPSDITDRKKMFYIRSAYRNQSDFMTAQLQRMGALLDAPQAAKMIDNEATVSDNYLRLVSASVESMYSGSYDELLVRDLRDQYIGQVRESMRRIFDGVLLKSLGDPFADGAFYFEKGTSDKFHYKNLSGGEKAAFDLMLDLVIKRRVYDNTVYCIDEPETHMHTRLQAQLLEELMALIPAGCQLWLATHAIGMMRKARDLQHVNPNEVVFLDFHDRDFDEPTILTPARVDRAFWAKTLNVALDDLALLVAPSRVVLCEGRPSGTQDTPKAEVDAKCYRVIFGTEYPDTDFLSIGNESDVRADKLGIGKTIQTLSRGTIVLRVIDRDDLNETEVAESQAAGIRVLSKRHLEAYLMDDEVLTELCASVGKPEKVAEVLAAKAQAISDSIGRGNPLDDVKSASGSIYVETKRSLQLTQCGNTVNAFLKDTLAPLIVPGLNTYTQLKRDIFGE